MHYSHAITREPGENFASGLTTSTLGVPTYDAIQVQHRAYVETLRSLGVEVQILPPLAEYPDAYFVEDVAVVAPNIAVVTRPGAPSRRGEQKFIMEALAKHRPIAHIRAPGTLDGGDVMQVDNHFFIGISSRTNKEGARQLSEILRYHGHTSTAVPVSGGLHLKSDVSYIGRHTLLITKSVARLEPFATFEKIMVDEDETYAANSLPVNDQLLMPKGFPHTKRKLERANFKIVEVETSEMRKMDGGLSCLSLRF